MAISSEKEFDVIQGIREVHRDVAEKLNSKRLKEVIEERREIAKSGDVVDKLVFNEYEIEGIRRGLIKNPKKRLAAGGKVPKTLKKTMAKRKAKAKKNPHKHSISMRSPTFVRAHRKSWEDVFGDESQFAKEIYGRTWRVSVVEDEEGHEVSFGPDGSEEEREWLYYSGPVSSGEILVDAEERIKTLAKNPCIGLHFHAKDADELLEAAEKSGKRQAKKNPKKSGGLTAAQKKKLRLGWGQVNSGFMISETVLSEPVRALAIYKKGNKWGSSVVGRNGQPIKLIETFKHPSAFAAAKSAEDIVLNKPTKKGRKKARVQKNPFGRMPVNDPEDAKAIRIKLDALMPAASSKRGWVPLRRIYVDHFSGYDRKSFEEAIRPLIDVGEFEIGNRGTDIRRTARMKYQYNPSKAGIEEFGKQIAEGFIQEKGPKAATAKGSGEALRAYAGEHWGVHVSTRGKKFNEPAEAAPILKSARAHLKAIAKVKNPCIGLHFHAKDADELLEAAEKSGKRQAEKNPKTLKGRVKRAEKKIGKGAKKLGREVKKDVKAAGKDVKKFAGTKTGYGALGAGAGALLLGPVGAVAGAVGGTKLHDNPKKKSAYKGRLPGGLADKCKPSDFDKKALAKGTKVELEHTGDRKLAQEIAMDHLVEHPGYYEALEKMERKLEAKGNPKKKTLRGRVKRAEKKAESTGKRVGKRVKKDVKAAGKDVKKFAGTKTGYGALGAGAGALLLGPLGAVAGAVGGAKLHDNPTVFNELLRERLPEMSDEDVIRTYETYDSMYRQSSRPSYDFGSEGAPMVRSVIKDTKAEMRRRGLKPTSRLNPSHRRKNPTKVEHQALADRKWNMFEDSWDSYSMSNSPEDLLGAYSSVVEAELHYTHAGIENEDGRGYSPASAEADGIRTLMLERLGG